MLYAFGVGEVAISMSGDRADERIFVHTVRDVGAVSGAIAQLEAGATIGVRGPFGTGWPVDGRGGVGCRHRRRRARPRAAAPGDLRISWPTASATAASSSSSAAAIPRTCSIAASWKQWRRRLDVDIEVTVDHADADWRGNVGVVPSLDPARGFRSAGGDRAGLRAGSDDALHGQRACARPASPPNRIYLSMERNMKCAIGLCGHCQFGPTFICKDGPVMRYDRIADIFAVREI